MEISDFCSEEILEYQIRKNTNRGQKLTRERNKIRNMDISLIKEFFPELKSVLCIGCRLRYEVKSFIKHGYDTIGIDVTNKCDLIKEIDAHKMDDFFEANQFDLSYMSHSLEHMYNALKVMENIRKISKEGTMITLPLGKGNPTLKHPTVFNIMEIDKEDKNIFLKPKKFKDIWSDFDTLQPFKILYGNFRKGINKKVPREAYFILKFEEKE